MSSTESFSSSLLLATLPTLSPPHFLSPVIHTATTLTRDRLVIVLFSRFFNVGPIAAGDDQVKGHKRRLSYPETQAISHTDPSNWNAVQRLLTFVYVQATKAAQEHGKILMDVVVLLKGHNEDLATDSTFVNGVTPEIVFRVSGDSIPTPLPPSIGLVRASYLPSGDTDPGAAPSARYATLSAESEHVRVQTPMPSVMGYDTSSSLSALGSNIPGRETGASATPDSTTITVSSASPHPTQAQVTVANTAHDIINVDGATSLSPGHPRTSEHAAPPSPPIARPHRPSFYPTTALGGTFDHLHAGHKILLSMGAWISSKKLIVGITSDVLLVKKPHAHLIQPLPLRKQRVREFLELFKPGLEYDLAEITDVYGPTGYDPDIQALVVSGETRKGGQMIATHRASKNLPQLETFTIDVISATEECLPHEDAEWLAKAKLSSTFIRGWVAEQQQQAKKAAGQFQDGGKN